MRILILGSTGLLGTTLSSCLVNYGHDIIRHGNKSQCDVSCDLTNLNDVCVLLDSLCPDVIINLVALTDVDACERDMHNAYLLNVKTVENIVTGIKEAHLVHISTDQVYDEKGLSREENIKLTNIYALTKYAGEIAARLTSSTILRTNIFGNSMLQGRNSFSDWVLDNLHQKNNITVLEDVVINPLSLESLSRVIACTATKRIEGVFNVGSHGAMSKADIAFEIAKLFDLPTTKMNRGLVSDMSFVAYRPLDMSMDCSKYEQVFDYKLPNLYDEIQSIKKDKNVNT